MELRAKRKRLNDFQQASTRHRQVDDKFQDGPRPSAPSMLRFSVFELDLRTGELIKNGHRIRLQDQPFQVLRLLLERRGEVVLREEIRKKLWPDNTIVEFDHSINAAIKRLRDELRDSAGKPRYIETLPRRGYRFIAQVESESLADLEEGQSQPYSVEEFTQALSGWLKDLKPHQSELTAGSRARLWVRKFRHLLGLR